MNDHEDECDPCWVWWQGGNLERFESEAAARADIEATASRGVRGTVYYEIEEAVLCIGQFLTGYSSNRVTVPDSDERARMHDISPHADCAWKIDAPFARVTEMFILYYDREDQSYAQPFYRENGLAFHYWRGPIIWLADLVGFLASELTAEGAMRWRLEQINALFEPSTATGQAISTHCRALKKQQEEIQRILKYT